MGFFSNLFGFGKSKVDPDYMSTAHLIPSYYSSFPVYQQKIIDTPQEKRTEKYDRLELYYYGRPLKEYYDLFVSTLNFAITSYSPTFICSFFDTIFYHFLCY